MPITVKSRIPAIIAEMHPRLLAEMKAGAEMIADEARQRVPVDTGRLRDSIAVKREGNGWTIIAEAKADSGAPYGHMVEFGTVHSSPQPFLVPALESQRAEIIAGANAVLRNL